MGRLAGICDQHASHRRRSRRVCDYMGLAAGSERYYGDEGEEERGYVEGAAEEEECVLEGGCLKEGAGVGMLVSRDCRKGRTVDV